MIYCKFAMAIHKLYLATLVYFLLFITSSVLAVRLTSSIYDVNMNYARITNTVSPNEGSEVCGSVAEGGTVQLTCLFGAKITHITFASFGNPLGSCGSFAKGTCEASNSLSTVQMACIGKQNCSVIASEAQFGSTPCKGPKTLDIQATC